MIIIFLFVAICYGIPIYLLSECFIRLMRIEKKIDKLPQITEKEEPRTDIEFGKEK